jgi:isoleucyl-tRNA synthetase
VHLLEWPEVPSSGEEPNAGQRSGLRRSTDWDKLRVLRALVTEAIEPLRRDKVIGSSLEAVVTLPKADVSPELAELFIVSSVAAGDALGVSKTDRHKCGRCWRHLPEVGDDGDLCNRCEDVVNG